MNEGMDGPGIRILAETDGMHLEAQVDPATHRVTAMTGRVTPPELYPVLLRASLGHSVQDVSEHAVIRVESMLRGHGPRPVPGVVQPENAGPQYRPLLALTRGLLKDYVAKTGYRIAMNTEEGQTHQDASEWGVSTVSERIQRILAAVPAVCPETGVRSADVRVESVAGPRVTVDFTAAVPKTSQQRYLTLLEQTLRAKVNPALELFLADKRDANVKRHGRDV